MLQMLRSFLFVLAILNSFSLCAQQMVYEVEVLGMNTGTLTVNRSREGSVTRITMNTEAGMNYLFGKSEASFSSSNIFVNGKLEGSYARNIRDGEEIRFTRLMCSNGTCEIETKEGKGTLEPQPKLCIAAIFFDEPKGVSQVFSEDWGRYLPIKYIGESTYQVTMPDGKTNDYIYKEGVLEELRSSTPVGKARVRRKRD